MSESEDRMVADEPSPDYQRRNFLKCAGGTVVAMTLPRAVFAEIQSGVMPVPSPYRIDPDVRTTVDRMIAFPDDVRGLAADQINRVSQYAGFGYGNWAFGAGLPVVQRTDLMPAGYKMPESGGAHKMARFFAFTDIHITDKEAPNQLLWFQQFERYAAGNTSIYSPVMLYTTQVLDAAIQTVNALHQKNPFDFGISLGDTCNSTQYNELRWYIDVIDGKVITPSSGAHLGADSVDYQKPFQAVGLNKSIPWYQVMGNHDHFFIGSIPVDADPSLRLRESYVSDQVWSVANVLVPDVARFPVLFDMQKLTAQPQYYAGVIDGSTPDGDLIHTGLATNPPVRERPPVVAADAKRRSLLRTEWIQEFFQTETGPVGHGFNLVDKAAHPGSTPGFACYSFIPKAGVPLKVIVLDDTQSEDDGSHDIHGHGYLDAARWEWLKSELAAGQAADQLMIIAAHIPIGVAAIGSELEWWLNEETTAVAHRNAVALEGLVATLQNTPNLLMWIAGHRHLNTIKAFKSADDTHPERGFWQVETSSLRDFPQQFRTVEIRLNGDYTVSIVTINVDTAIAEGSPAAQSRKCAVAVQQIVKTNLHQNTRNAAQIKLGALARPLPSMDPSRPQDDAQDPSIQFMDLRGSGVPYHASCNAELRKPLSPAMTEALKHWATTQASTAPVS